jgi:hypothetical protein
MSEPERGFLGLWIKAEIWLAADLTFLAKGLLAEIESLGASERGCFASNKYFASFFGVSASQISRTLADLKRRGLIDVRTVMDPAVVGGTVRYLSRTQEPLPQRTAPMARTETVPAECGDTPSADAGGPAAKCADPPCVDASLRVESRESVESSGSKPPPPPPRDRGVLPDAAAAPATDPTRASDPDPPSRAVALLLQTRLFSRAKAEALAQGWSVEEVAAWIARARDRPPGTMAGFLVAMLSDKTNPPPESVIRQRERAAKQAILQEQLARARERSAAAFEGADEEARIARVLAEYERHKARRERAQGRATQ